MRTRPVWCVITVTCGWPQYNQECTPSRPRQLRCVPRSFEEWMECKFAIVAGGEQDHVSLPLFEASFRSGRPGLQ